MGNHQNNEHFLPSPDFLLPLCKEVSKLNNKNRIPSQTEKRAKT